MTLTSVQYEEGGRTESVLDTVISYKAEKDGSYVIGYEESEATGLGGSTIELRYSPDGMVSVHRSGEFQTNLIIREGVKHFCHYETPFGEFAVGVLGKQMRSTLTENGGTLHFRYTVDANATLLSDTEITAEVRRLKTEEK